MDTLLHYQGNFLEELRGVGTYNTAPLVSINETDAVNLRNRYDKEGYIVISPCHIFAKYKLNRDNSTDVDKLVYVNTSNVRECLKMIRDGGFSYIPLYGGSVENEGTDQVREVFQCAFIVYSCDKKGISRPFDELKSFAIDIANKYNQDEVLVAAPCEAPTYYKIDGSKGEVLETNMSFNDLLQKYFTNLHKKATEVETKEKPTPLTFIGCFINPAPQCLSEAHTRYLSGEICLRYR